MIPLGTVRPGSTIEIPFETFAGSTGAPITMTGLAASTTNIKVYKDGSTTERASASGYALLDTDGIDFDGLTGVHGFTIDLSDNTTADFWASGSRYTVVVTALTVDSQTVRFVAATFRIGHVGAVLDTTIATLASQTSFTLAAGSADDDAYNGCSLVCYDAASAVQMCLGVIEDYTGSTKTVTLAASPGVFTMAAKDNIAILPRALQATVPGRTLDVSTGGEAGVDWANVGTQGSTVGLSGTTVATVTTTTTATNLTNAPTNGDLTATMKTSVTTAATAATPTAAAVTGAVGSVTGNVGGNVVGSVASVAGAVGSVTGNVGGNVTGSVGSVVGAVGSVTGAVGSVTGNVGGNVAGSVGSLGAQAKLDVNAEADAALSDVGVTTTVTGRIDAAISTRLASASYTAPLDAAGTRSAVGLASANLDSQLDALPTAAENQSGMATAANLATVDTVADAIKAVTDKLDTAMELDAAVYRFTTNALEQAPSGGGGGTDWTADEKTAIKTILGVPASGTTPDAPSAGALKVIDDFLDTEVAAIKAKTDLIPAAPAAVGDIPTAAQVRAEMDSNSTKLADILTDTADMQPKLGTPAASLAADLAAVKVDTAAVKVVTDAQGATGAGLSAIPWNASWDAEVQSEVADALVAYDPPTKAELDSAVAPLALEATLGGVATSATNAAADALIGRKIMEAMPILDTATTPWSVKLIQKGTGTAGANYLDGTVLRTVYLYTAAGAAVTAATQVVASQRDT